MKKRPRPKDYYTVLDLVVNRPKIRLPNSLPTINNPTKTIIDGSSQFVVVCTPSSCKSLSVKGSVWESGQYVRSRNRKTWALFHSPLSSKHNGQAFTVGKIIATSLASVGGVLLFLALRSRNRRTETSLWNSQSQRDNSFQCCGLVSSLPLSANRWHRSFL